MDRRDARLTRTFISVEQLLCICPTEIFEVDKRSGGELLLRDAVNKKNLSAVVSAYTNCQTALEDSANLDTGHHPIHVSVVLLLVDPLVPPSDI
jgi:hypothetical protein